MKITKQTLKQLIKEELQKIAEEGPLDRVKKAKEHIDNLLASFEDKQERNAFLNDLILHLKAIRQKDALQDPSSPESIGDARARAKRGLRNLRYTGKYAGKGGYGSDSI